MPKTRQQRSAEARAGHPPSPPQSLEDKPRVSKRTRAKTPNAAKVTPGATQVTSSASKVAGPVLPATQSTVRREPQALLRIWVDVDPGNFGQPFGDATHQETIPSSRVPELVTFLENICSQEKDKVPESSSKP